jgi:hypothetical protein
MTSTERARAFISNKLKRTALIILPLAAAAVQAHAGVIFTLGSGNGSMSASGNAATNVTTPFSSTQILNGVNGISLFGAATYTVNLSGGGTGAPSGSFCQNVCGGFDAFGGGSGNFDADTLLTNYDFILSDNNGEAIQWSLFVQVNGSQGQANGIVTSGTEVINSLTLTGLSGQALESWTAELEVDFQGGTFNPGDTLTVNIPGGASVDIGAVPEPGTGALMAIAGAALAGFAAIRRRLA